MIKLIKKAAFYLGYPFYGYLDRRFADVLTAIHKAQQDLSTSVSADAHLVTESVNYIERMAQTGSEIKPAARSDASLPRLTEDIAKFMNRADSYKGYAAQSRLWFNPPTVLEYQKDSVKLSQLHDRIIEMPFAYACAAQLPPDAHVLDIGSSESLLAITLANLGFNVTSLDIRSYPIEHPRIKNVVCDATEWTGPEKPFDAIFCISTIEHFGIMAYGYAQRKPDLDLQAMELFKKWLRPGGHLFLTVPYGKFEITELERIYDAKRIEQLLQGWKITSRAAYAHVEPTRWEKADDESIHTTWEGTKHGVLLIKAERP